MHQQCCVFDRARLLHATFCAILGAHARAEQQQLWLTLPHTDVPICHVAERSQCQKESLSIQIPEPGA